MITCRESLVEKSVDEYWKTPAGNPRKICKACQYLGVLARKAKDPDAWKIQKLGIIRKHKYGVTVEQVKAMLVAQSYTCAICPVAIDYVSAHLDHCHDTGKVRGLLCKNCNWGLGHFRDNIAYLEQAINYLRG